MSVVAASAAISASNAAISAAAAARAEDAACRATIAAFRTPGASNQEMVVYAHCVDRFNPPSRDNVHLIKVGIVTLMVVMTIAAVIGAIRGWNESDVFGNAIMWAFGAAGALGTLLVIGLGIGFVIYG